MYTIPLYTCTICTLWYTQRTQWWWRSTPYHPTTVQYVHCDKHREHSDDGDLHHTIVHLYNNFTLIFIKEYCEDGDVHHTIVHLYKKYTMIYTENTVMEMYTIPSYTSTIFTFWYVLWDIHGKHSAMMEMFTIPSYSCKISTLWYTQRTQWWWRCTPYHCTHVK